MLLLALTIVLRPWAAIVWAPAGEFVGVRADWIFLPTVVVSTLLVLAVLPRWPSPTAIWHARTVADAAGFVLIWLAGVAALVAVDGIRAQPLDAADAALVVPYPTAALLVGHTLVRVVRDRSRHEREWEAGRA